MRYWTNVARLAHAEARSWVDRRLGHPMSVVFLSVGSGTALAAWSPGDIPPLIAGAIGALGSILVLYVVLLARGFVTIPPRLDAEKSDALTVSDDTITNLTVRPKRVSFVDLAMIAQRDFGWDFTDPGKMHYTDFMNAILQAAVDQHLFIEGRHGCMNSPKHMRDLYLFETVPVNYLRNFRIEVPSFFRETDNYWITTIRDDADQGSRFRDLHFSNEVKAVEWLRRCGEEWKGRSMKAALEHKEETDNFLRSVGLPVEVTDTPEKG